MCSVRTRKSIVDDAIAFRNPERVPVWVDGGNIGLSDILTYDLSLSDKDDPRKSEWGFRRVRAADGSWLVPKEPFLAEWSKVDEYKRPAQDPARRLARIPAAAKVVGDRYRLASFGLSGYSVYSALRGADLAAVDFLIETDRFLEVMDLILEFETEMFDLLARKGFNGVEFCDDWGPRGVSRITLSMWRCLFRDRYSQQFRSAKEAGLDVWVSTSPEGVEFFDDLRQIGASVIRLDRPSTLDVAAIGRPIRGKVAFATRVDDFLNDDDPAGMIDHNRQCLGVLGGGFIATIGANVPQEQIRFLYDIVKEFKNA